MKQTEKVIKKNIDGVSATCGAISSSLTYMKLELQKERVETEKNTEKIMGPGPRGCLSQYSMQLMILKLWVQAPCWGIELTSKNKNKNNRQKFQICSKL